MTLEVVDFFAADFLGVALLAVALALLAVALLASFLLLLAGFAATVLLAAFALTVLFRTVLLAAVVLDTVARFAFGFEADFVLTARFAVLEDALFDVDRAVDLRKPFERLLLIWV